MPHLVEEGHVDLGDEALTAGAVALEIAPEEIDTLFEPFGQTQTGRKAQEGTGLGLSISRKFVQLMGGDMTVKSVLGQDTTFAFDIQVRMVDESTIDNRQSTVAKRVLALEPGQPCYRMLIVDDKADQGLRTV